MRIGYCTSNDPFDRRAWSGINYNMMKALERHCGDLVPLGPLHTKSLLAGKILNRLLHAVSGRNFDYSRSPFLSRRFASLVKPRILEHKPDVLFFSGASWVLARLEVHGIPNVYFSDSTVKNLVGYYDFFSNLLSISVKWSNETERMAIERADIIVYPSPWAADSAVNDYGCPREKIHVIPCGANLDPDLTPSREEIAALKRDSRDTLELLFIGGDWERKGGDIAFKAMIELNRRGIETGLTVCGRAPAPVTQHEKVNFVGFLNQNDREELLKFHRLYSDASIFVLPTRSEAYGCVFAEASAYGLPIVGAHTGGVPAYVDEGVTGCLLPEGADFVLYADKIEYIWLNKDRYRAFSENGRAKFEKELNWDAWGRKVNDLIEEVRTPGS